MTREITIGVKKTFTDWGLILTGLSIGYPTPKTEYIDIPYADGSLDMTGQISGDVRYNNRKCTFNFDMICDPSERQSLINEIANYLHGIKYDIVMPDDPNYLYSGRLEINTFQTSMILNKLVIEAVCDPYKLKPADTVYDVTINASGKTTVTCSNGRKRVVPTITTTAEVTLVYGDKTMVLSPGTYKQLALVFKQGDNVVELQGAPGTQVTFRYREGLI